MYVTRRERERERERERKGEREKKRKEGIHIYVECLVTNTFSFPILLVLSWWLRSPGAHRLHHRKTEAEEDNELLAS